MMFLIRRRAGPGNTTTRFKMSPPTILEDHSVAVGRVFCAPRVPQTTLGAMIRAFAHRGCAASLIGGFRVRHSVVHHLALVVSLGPHYEIGLLVLIQGPLRIKLGPLQTYLWIILVVFHRPFSNVRRFLGFTRPFEEVETFS